MGEAPKDIFILGDEKGLLRAESKGGFLGVETMTLEDDLAKYFDVEHGVMIQRVVEDTPAEEIGLMAGDVIVAIDGDKIKSTSELGETIRKHKPDSEVEVHFMRKGKKMTKKTKLAGRSFGPMIPDFDFDFDFKDLEFNKQMIHEAIKEAMEALHENRDEISNEMRESMNELKKEMQKLKEELKKQKEDKSKD